MASTKDGVVGLASARPAALCGGPLPLGELGALAGGALSAAGFVQFAKGPDVDYDPVCFDLSRQRDDHDCPIVKFDHEEILQHRRLVQVSELAPSFRGLVERLVSE